MWQLTQNKHRSFVEHVIIHNFLRLFPFQNITSHTLWWFLYRNEVKDMAAVLTVVNFFPLELKSISRRIKVKAVTANEYCVSTPQASLWQFNWRAILAQFTKCILGHRGKKAWPWPQRSYFLLDRQRWLWKMDHSSAYLFINHNSFKYGSKSPSLSLISIFFQQISEYHNFLLKKLCNTITQQTTIFPILTVSSVHHL